MFEKCFTTQPSHESELLFFEGCRGAFDDIIRRPESAWLANILCRIQTVSIDPNPSPKSKIRNPKSKRCRLGPPQKERRLNWSKIQNPKSKIQTGRLEFGFWIWSGRDRGRWPCSKWRCMAVLATWIWPSWRRASLQPKGCRLDSRHERPKLGTDFRRRGFAGNRGSISSPVFWKLGPNFRRNLGWLRAAPTMRVRAKDVNITWFSCKPSKYT